MMDISKSYERDEFLSFLRDRFLPDDFESFEPNYKNINTNKSNAVITEAVKLGLCKSLDMSVYEFKHHSGNDPRVTLSREAFSILKNNDSSPNALSVFYNEDSSQWRLSLITSDYNLAKENRAEQTFSNPRRYSYLLGERCKRHTPEMMLITKGRIKSVDDIISRFAVDVVTKEFYQKLFAWYEWALPLVRYPEGTNNAVQLTKAHNEMHLIRLITRLIFVWFIKQKNLVPEWIFNETDIHAVLKSFHPQSRVSGDYYNGILQNLFFATLNKETEERGFTKDKNEYGNNEFGINSYYRDRKSDSYFKVSTDEIKQKFADIPFLNGGLFECLDKSYENPKKPGYTVQEYHDGFSREKERCAFVPDILFFGNGENGNPEGLITLFNRYNFTVEENTPVDIDVALDPELLGKVFENLLGYYNEETRTTARKESGSFYTPREIVDYMVTESLTVYLSDNNEKTNKGKIEKLFSYSDEAPELDDNERHDLIKKIDSCKILDPACGSGAFPMGTLNKLSLALSKLDKDGKLWKERQEERARGDAASAFTIDDKNARDKKLNEISATFEFNKSKYGHKLYLIENCMFGVDIKPIAIQITKLRFFISLIVEQERDVNKPNFGIRALPNLETKFVCANTLIVLAEKTAGLLDLEDDTIRSMKNKLWNTRELHFYAKNAKQKRELRDEDKKIREKIKQYLLETSAKPNDELIERNDTLIAKLEKDRELVKEENLVDTSKDNQHLFDNMNDGLPQYIDINAEKRAEIDIQIKFLQDQNEFEKTKADNTSLKEDIQKIACWDPYDQNAEAAQFFDPYWMFGVDKGFDIVIGNPPYVRADNPVMAEQRAAILKSEQYETLWEKWDLMVPFIERGLKQAKHGGFLTFVISDAITTSKYAEKLQDWIVSNHGIKSIDYFENIKVFEAGVTPIVLMLRSGIKEKQILKIYRKDTFDNKEIVSVDSSSARNKIFRKVFSDAFNPSIECELLGNICYLSVGMVINADEKTVKGEFGKDDLISDKKDKIHCKKYVEGKGISAYSIDNIKYLEYNTNRVPSKLRRPTFEALYSGEKILRGRVTKGTFDDSGIICNDSIIVFKRFCDLRGVWERSIISSISKNNFETKGGKTNAHIQARRSELEKTSENFSLKYILAVINSKYSMAYLNNYRRHRLKNYFYPDDFRNFPLAKIPIEEQTPFITLVDKILAAKAANPKADTSSLESRIDKMVYQLYGLTDDEVKVIEEKD
ncbi:MAG: Eco57I restriction-modification methylase domain-containing protein [Prevotellaceae bacterium]|jgi:hypothetical protein|nr:Eco57I restriction-modification methylase domain-containing protein [Prevotellaceae bacterium]